MRMTSLADILRGKGLPVEELPNWKTTSRQDDRSEYKSGCPNHFMHHHTASPASAHTDHNKCRGEARQLQLAEPNEPTSNTATCTHGTWFVIAAGPTNTNGTGEDKWHPVGDKNHVPANSMNSYAIGNEMMNNGVGERYSDVMLNNTIIGTAAICLAYGIQPFNNRAHFEWTGRKIDPAGPCKFAKLSDPYLRWDMGEWRSAIAEEMARQHQRPPVPPPVGDDNMMQVFRCAESPAYVAWDGVDAAVIPSWDLWNIGKFVGLYPDVPEPPILAKSDLQAILDAFAVHEDAVL